MAKAITQFNKKIRPSMKKDPIKASDFLKYKIPFACEDCSHFSSQDIRCTLGFNCQNHLRTKMLADYNLSGKMPQCRFLEID